MDSLEALAPVNDLTHRAEFGEVQPAFFREKEILATLEVLARRSRRNVLIVGEKGVGKTHLVRGIAVAGVRGETVGLLEDLRIVELETGLMLVGTDELRSKLERLLRHLRNFRDTVLFVDDIHQILDLESSEASSKTYLANMLKHALFRGEISCIATTTPEGLERALAHDRLFRDHFEFIELKPMTSDTTRKLLRRLRADLERHHKVGLSDECVDTTITLCERFISDDHFPAAAIDILDRACSRTRFKSMSEENIEALIAGNRFDSETPEVTVRDVQLVIRDVAGVSQSRLTFADMWEQMETVLSTTFIGQSFAVGEILRTLRNPSPRSRLRGRPEAVFLFWGPPNSGKSLMAAEIAKLYHGSSSSLVRFDMDRFDKKAFAKKIETLVQDQAHPTKSRKQTDRESPSVLLLFERIEQASAEDFEFLWPILENGDYAHPSGKQFSLRNTLVVLTTSQGAERVTRDRFDGLETVYVERIRKSLSPEFSKQIDTIVPFMPLTRNHVREMINMRVKQLRKELIPKRIDVSLGREATEHLTDTLGDDFVGLMGLFAILERVLVEPVRAIIRDARPASGTLIFIARKDDQLDFQQITREERSRSGRRRKTR